ncbi:hypothetical protein SteCoe_15974 [Stentor coeruleus]|uniref:Uncharacterized protein n=1 Tax=Stentor coeruleus TaxID=5963 RepID=A0A1R2C2D3_9CILI|nr:hypothetical protein SteCoe_15974 [Stentor coeruleus]
MEVTKSKEEKDLYLLLMANLFDLHPNKAIPAIPWFHSYRNKASETLMEALRNAGFVHDKFAKKVIKILLNYKSQNEDENMKKASLLRESIDIANAMRLATVSKIIENQLVFRLRKSQSIFGPVTMFILYKKFVFSLDEGEEVKFPVKLSDNTTVKFSLFGDEEKLKITEKLISLSKTLGNFHYLSVMEKGIIEDQLNIKSEEYEIIVDFQLFISKSERVKKLASKNAECDGLMNEINNKENVYESLLQILKLRETDVGYESTITEGSMRDRCCADCILF